MESRDKKETGLKPLRPILVVIGFLLISNVYAEQTFIGDPATKTCYSLECPRAKMLIEFGRFVRGYNSKGFEQIGYKKCEVCQPRGE